MAVLWCHGFFWYAMAVAEQGLNDGKKWLGTEFGIDTRCIGCDKSEK